MKRKQRQRGTRLIAVMLSLSILAGISGGWNLAADTAEEEAWTPQTEAEEKGISPLLPVILQEDMTKRGEYEKHFLCDDGSYMAVSYPEPVHVLQDGTWTDIDYAPEAAGPRLAAHESGHSISLANASSPDESRLVSIEASGYEISWTVEAQTIPAAQRSRTAERQTASRKLAAVDAQVTTGLELTEQNRVEVTPTELDNLTDQKAAVQADLDESGDTWSPEVNEAVRVLNEDIQAVNQHIISAVSFASAMVEYPQALGEHTTLRYTMSPGKIKEEVVIDTPDALDTYCVRMNTNGLTAVPDANKGIHLQNDEGEDVVYIAPPLLYDAADEISRNVAVSMTQEGDKCVLTYTPDKEWLNDEARVWPVVIDPTVSSVTIAQQNQIDNYVYEGQTAPLNDSSSDLYVGCYSRGGTLRDHRAYWQLASLPTLPSGTSPTNASFHIRLKNGTSSMGAIELYKAGSGWNSYMLKWSNRPDPSTYLGERASVPSGSEKWLVYDSGAVTNVVKDWYNYPSSNHGFILKYRTCVNDYNTFYSSDYRPDGSTAFIPYLSVSYVDTIPVSQVCLSPSSKTIGIGTTFRLTASVLPSNATNKGIIYSTDDYSIADVDPLTGIVTAVGLGTTTIYATSGSNQNKFAICTVKVLCGGANYQDVTKHNMFLNESDAYYHCRVCQYKVKSPALQDASVLNKSDYLSIVSLYHDYLLHAESHPERAEAMLAAIDYIRGLPENRTKYEFKGVNGIYQPEYAAQIKEINMWVRVDKGSCYTEWVLMNTLFPIIGGIMPPPYSYMFSIVSSAIMQEHPGAESVTGNEIMIQYASALAGDFEIIPKSVAIAIETIFSLDSVINGTTCSSECYNVNMVFNYSKEDGSCYAYQVNYHFSEGIETLGRGNIYSVSVPGRGPYKAAFDYIDNVNDRSYSCL